MIQLSGVLHSESAGTRREACGAHLNSDSRPVSVKVTM